MIINLRALGKIVIYLNDFIFFLFNIIYYNNVNNVKIRLIQQIKDLGNQMKLKETNVLMNYLPFLCKKERQIKL